MTDETSVAPKRPRGRPRKNPLPEDNQIAEPVLNSPEQDVQAMQDQIRYQLMQLIKLTENAGVSIQDIYETPPVEDTVVLTKSDQVLEDVIEPAPVDIPGKIKPGSLVGNGMNATWVPWRKSDLDSKDTVDFVPQPVPSLVFPMPDEEGRQKIKLDVNDLVCWLTVGIPNVVNRFFYNAYMDAYNSWRELESFKRRGPEYAPWGNQGPGGRPSWHYEPMAHSYGLDENGHYLAAGRRPMIDAPRVDETSAEPI